jgi:hypothetical protein
MVQFCTETGLIAGNTRFKKKLVNKYKWLRDKGADEALIDWMLVERLQGSLNSVNVLRSWGGVTGTDRFPVVAMMCWRRTWYEIKE